MKFKRTIRDELSINITPLIDVVFLLLIFFMVTTTFNRETRLLVNLPEANAELAESTPLQIEIMVARDGSYSINGRALVNNRLETLRVRIGSLETTILPERQHLFGLPFGDYLAPGVHLLDVFPCCGGELVLSQP